jgi:hypothetical protein
LTEADPEGTVTEAGRVNAGLLEDSATVAFPLGAAAESVTVQVDVEPEAKVAGEQCKLAILSGGRTVIVPPVPAMLVPFPLGEAPPAPIREIGTTEPLPAAPSVTVAVATVPLPIELAFMPAPTQVIDPPAAAQYTVFPTAVRASPGATLMEAILPGA